MAIFLRRLVSQKKRRFVQDGFDLDLSYITQRIIAMGFPAEGGEGLIRNPMQETVKFLQHYHPNHHKVYNLCAEKTYSTDKFKGPVEHYPFDDHQPPPLHLVDEFVLDAYDWLTEDPENVIAVHCKAGKGRTGVMICCLLIHLAKHNPFVTEDLQLGNDKVRDVLQYYAFKRTVNNKGISLYSQQRFVQYFHHRLRGDVMNGPVPVHIKEIRIKNLPQQYLQNAVLTVSERPTSAVQTTTYISRPVSDRQSKGGPSCFTSSATGSLHGTNVFITEDREICAIFSSSTAFDAASEELKNDGLLEGDIKVQLFKGSDGGSSIFYTWFNTAFLPIHSNDYTVFASELDRPTKGLPSDVEVQVIYSHPSQSPEQNFIHAASTNALPTVQDLDACSVPQPSTPDAEELPAMHPVSSLPTIVPVSSSLDWLDPTSVSASPTQCPSPSSPQFNNALASSQMLLFTSPFTSPTSLPSVSAAFTFLDSPASRRPHSSLAESSLVENCSSTEAHSLHSEVSLSPALPASCPPGCIEEELEFGMDERLSKSEPSLAFSPAYEYVSRSTPAKLPVSRSPPTKLPTHTQPPFVVASMTSDTQHTTNSPRPDPRLPPPAEEQTPAKQLPAFATKLGKHAPNSDEQQMHGIKAATYPLDSSEGSASYPLLNISPVSFPSPSASSGAVSPSTPANHDNRKNPLFSEEPTIGNTATLTAQHSLSSMASSISLSHTAPATSLQLADSGYAPVHLNTPVQGPASCSAPSSPSMYATPLGFPDYISESSSATVEQMSPAQSTSMYSDTDALITEVLNATYSTESNSFPPAPIFIPPSPPSPSYFYNPKIETVFPMEPRPVQPSPTVPPLPIQSPAPPSNATILQPSPTLPPLHPSSRHSSQTQSLYPSLQPSPTPSITSNNFRFRPPSIMLPSPGSRLASSTSDLQLPPHLTPTGSVRSVSSFSSWTSYIAIVRRHPSRAGTRRRSSLRRASTANSTDRRQPRNLLESLFRTFRKGSKHHSSQPPGPESSSSMTTPGNMSLTSAIGSSLTSPAGGQARWDGFEDAWANRWWTTDD